MPIILFYVRKVNVFVTTNISKDNLERIANADPAVNLTSVAELYKGERNGDADATFKLDALLPEAEVAFGLNFPDNMIARAHNLKWIQVFLSGIDYFKAKGLMPEHIVFTKTAGIQGTAMAESIICCMLMFAKQMPTYFQNKLIRNWGRAESITLHGKTLGILGLGNVGKELAHLGKAFGMRVIANRRSAKKVGRARNVDLLLPSSHLHQLLKKSDFVVLTLPLTPDTQKMIGVKEFNAMKNSAYIINISRGQIIDEDALIEALVSKQIAGAGLDVFAVEPLPLNSVLWDMPNVIISPHVAANMDGFPELATELFCENLRRYINGRKLLNVVDKETGY
ncbi:D-2-hydroxyacid dehydrogenase [Chloroflexota bacterium]